jgi:hypothetical protein
MILRTAVRNHCIKKGLKENDDHRLYFPHGFIPNNRLPFKRYDGKKISINIVGERKFRIISKGNTILETSRYHLSPDFRFFEDLLGDPVLRLQIYIYWTDLQGYPLEAKTQNRRRKKLCKDWWNYEWLSRMMALMQWFGDGEDELTLIKSDSGDLRISLKPVTFSSEFGIDENKLKPIKKENEQNIIEDSEEDLENAEDSA